MKAMYKTKQKVPVITRVQLNPSGSSKTVVFKFIPNTAVTIANIVATKVAAVRSNSNCIS